MRATHRSIPRSRVILACLLFLWQAARAGIPGTGVAYPVVTVPAVSVFHQGYPVDSPKLKAALAGSKGDSERCEITLAVSEYVYRSDNYYHGYRMAAVSVTKFDPRTGTYASLTSQVTIDPSGQRRSTMDSDPVQITAERRSFFCRNAGGDVSERIEVKSKCMLIHRVTRPASSPGTHAWNPVSVGVLFFTHPERSNCSPTARSARSLRFEASLLPGEAREFGVESVGFVDEACEDPTGSVLYFLPTGVTTFTPPNNAR